MAAAPRPDESNPPPGRGAADAGDDTAAQGGADGPMEINPVTPDAVSPVVRTDGDGPVIGGGTRDTGAGTVGGRDASGPGGREPLRRPGADERRGLAGSDDGDGDGGGD